MVRLVHERKIELCEVDEVDVVTVVGIGCCLDPFGDRAADTALADTSENDHQPGHKSLFSVRILELGLRQRW